LQLNFDNIITNTDELLSKVSEKDIYEYYLGHSIKDGKLYKCPFHNDSSPSIGFKLMPSDTLIHRCFGCGARGNSINFVSKLLNLSYKDTINRIKTDLIVEERKSFSTKIKSERFSSEPKGNIFPVKQYFCKTDYDYWNSYFIPLKLLQKYNVSACKQVFVKKEDTFYLFAEYSNTNPIYCYTINNSFKIYRPFNPTKRGKWLNSILTEDIQGMQQLPKSGDLLIITSSMKDVLVLKILGYLVIYT